jgi:hypothetical protein
MHDLPADSPIAAVLTDEYIQKQKAWVEAEPDLRSLAPYLDRRRRRGCMREAIHPLE